MFDGIDKIHTEGGTDESILDMFKQFDKEYQINEEKTFGEQYK